MRGKESRLLSAFLVAGITPAYAGKRKICYTKSTGKQDHPRLCGEKPDWDGLDKTAQGSPPPMRGKGVPHQNT